ATLQTLAAQAQTAGARLALVTRAPASPLDDAAETVLVLPTPADPVRAGGLAGSQPLGTRFEQGLVILLDLVFAATLQRVGADNDALQRRHANLE
ncbi:MAG: 6-phospho-3-hexuloisomerase, partial [Planctomycetota bacterium]